MNNFLLKILVFIILFVSVAKADIVYLKNGSELKGIVVEQNDGSINLKVEIGNIFFQRDEIEKIDILSESENNLMQKQWEEKKAAEKELGSKKTGLLQQKKAKILDYKKKNAKNKSSSKNKITKHAFDNTYYLLSLPQDYSKNRKYPLVLGLHGYPSKPEILLKKINHEKLTENAIIVYLKSPDKRWMSKDVEILFKLIRSIK